MNNKLTQYELNEKYKSHLNYIESNGSNGTKLDLSNVSCVRINFTGKDLSGLNLSNSEFSYCSFNGSNLTDADLTNSKLCYCQGDGDVIKTIIISGLNVSIINDGRTFVNYQQFQTSELDEQIINAIEKLSTTDLFYDAKENLYSLKIIFDESIHDLEMHKSIQSGVLVSDEFIKPTTETFPYWISNSDELSSFMEIMCVEEYEQYVELSLYINDSYKCCNELKRIEDYESKEYKDKHYELIGLIYSIIECTGSIEYV